jgi:hypothetical protein
VVVDAFDVNLFVGSMDHMSVCATHSSLPPPVDQYGLLCLLVCRSSIGDLGHVCLPVADAIDGVLIFVV